MNGFLIPNPQKRTKLSIATQPREWRHSNQYQLKGTNVYHHWDKYQP